MGAVASVVETAVNVVVDTAVSAGNAIADVATTAGNAIVGAGQTAINAITGTATDAYNYAKKLEQDVESRTESIAATIASTTTELANAGLDVTSSEFQYLAGQVQTQVMNGVHIAEDYAMVAYRWADENACRMGLTAAISMGCVAAFTPAQPEGAVASTTLSLMAQPVLYTADMGAKMVVAGQMGSFIADAFLKIPGVDVDATLLTNVISNCIYYSLDSASLWATPAGVGIAIGAAVAPIVANLVCTRTCPEGFTKALGA